jgi:hypothetical protein
LVLCDIFRHGWTRIKHGAEDISHTGCFVISLWDVLGAKKGGGSSPTLHYLKISADSVDSVWGIVRIIHKNLTFAKLL